MKSVLLSNILSNEEQRQKEHVVTIITQLNDGDFLSLRSLASAFWEQFETSLCIMPVGSSEVWLVTISDEPIDRLKRMETFVDGWVAGRLTK